MNTSLKDVLELAKAIRVKVLELSHAAQTPHLASALSCVDILATLYSSVLKIDPKKSTDPTRDRFILSKGHAATTLYATLALKGFFDEHLLGTFNEAGSLLPEQPLPFAVPGVEAATGSLGHGLPIGLGMAVAGKIQKASYRVIVLVSDGECNEGSVWEAALLAPRLGVNNLTVIVDYNKWQATGKSDEVMSLKPLRLKWESFGWTAVETDGHDLKSLLHVLTQTTSSGTIAIVAHTIKGKGVSFMEDDNNWHYRSPNKEELEKAKSEVTRR